MLCLTMAYFQAQDIWRTSTLQTCWSSQSAVREIRHASVETAGIHISSGLILVVGDVKGRLEIVPQHWTVNIWAM